MVKKILLIFCAILLLQSVSAKSIVVSKKESQYYNGNMTKYCVYKKTHKDIEVINNHKYIEVKKKNVLIASFDPINIDRNSIYIWVELSPNGKMILFTTSDQGTFVCNLKGEILCSLGKGVNATNWWDNRYLVGMCDKDNGIDFIKSDLVLVDIKTGEKLLIATDEEISVYPCAKKPYVEYFTLDNQKHTIKLKIK